PLPARLAIAAPQRQTLRYGENPHQQAALYVDAGAAGGVAQGRLLQGKELSFNNLVDLDAAWALAQEFEAPAVAIIKHTNPAGCATAGTLTEAYQRALACDPVSAYGGVIGLNRALDGEAAEAMSKLFLECIVAPGFTPEAQARLAGKKNLRLLEVAAAAAAPALRSISGGWLLQTPDDRLFASEPPSRVVSRRQPSSGEQAGMRFGWAVAKHVKSNAIVFARATAAAGETLAVGAGQMSRVDAVRIAGLRAQLPLAGSAVASDAFFPFPDGIEEAARLGATAVIQPGGSVHDADAIAACDRLDLAMVFTAMRHFRH
ncbi:MAG: bifunctional phosphoribosylaminoimidazolecarboxamide formyltransferase/IMP cyclohydrolase, partial [Terriglobales bacterium]